MWGGRCQGDRAAADGRCRAPARRALRGPLRAASVGESRPTAALPADNPYCSCTLTRVRAILKVERYWDVFGDKYGSHVAQTLLDVTNKLLHTCESDVLAELLQRLTKLVRLSAPAGAAGPLPRRRRLRA